MEEVLPGTTFRVDTEEGKVRALICALLGIKHPDVLSVKIEHFELHPYLQVRVTVKCAIDDAGDLRGVLCYEQSSALSQACKIGVTVLLKSYESPPGFRVVTEPTLIPRPQNGERTVHCRFGNRADYLYAVLCCLADVQRPDHLRISTEMHCGLYTLCIQCAPSDERMLEEFLAAPNNPYSMACRRIFAAVIGTKPQWLRFIFEEDSEPETLDDDAVGLLS